MFFNIFNITTQLHFNDLITFHPSNDLIIEEHLSDLFDIFLTKKRMDSERKTYLPYKEMSSGKLDLYYFCLD